jgi:voltage-gated potassium channel
MIPAMSIRRLLLPIYLFLITYLLGTLGYYVLGMYGADAGIIEKPWPIMSCLFMTAISLTTVGYGDYLGINNYPLAQIYTIVLLFVGMGVVLYVISEATSIIVEGHLRRLIERRRMMKTIDTLEGHVILCGLGDTGSAAFQELCIVGTPFVAVDDSEETCEKLREQRPSALIVVGNALDEDTLRQARIDRAGGFIACLSDDRDNVLLTITARVMNPGLRIIARAKSVNVGTKLRAAGANQVITPTLTGGLRLASEMVRPHVTSFLDTMLRDSGNFRFIEAELKAGSPLVGSTIAESRLRQKTGLTIIALRNAAGDYVYNADVERTLDEGDVLIAVGMPDNFRTLRDLCAT